MIVVDDQTPSGWFISHTPEECVALSVGFAGWIEERYGVSPMKRVMPPDPSTDLILGKALGTFWDFDFYVFNFDNGAYVEMRVPSEFPPGRERIFCGLTILYHPPTTSLPF